MSPFARIRRYVLIGALVAGAVLLVGIVLIFWQEAQTGRHLRSSTDYHLRTIRLASQVQAALFRLEAEYADAGPAGAELVSRRGINAIDPMAARIEEIQRRFGDGAIQATVARTGRQWVDLRGALEGLAARNETDIDRIRSLVLDLSLTMRQLERLHSIAFEGAQQRAAGHSRLAVGLFIPVAVSIVLVGAVLVLFFYRQIGHTLDRLQDVQADQRSSEAQLLNAQRIAHLGSYEWDVVRDKLRWSEETCRIFGLAPGEGVPSVADFVARIHPEDRDRVWAEVQAALAGEAPYDTRFRIVRPDGTVRLLQDEAEVVRDADGRAGFMRGAVLDVTEAAEAEEALRLSEARLIGAQRIAKLGNWNWDVVTNELYWSDQIYRIFGLEPQEFGATYEAFLHSVHPDDREIVQDAVNRALEEGGPYSIRHRIVQPDGAERIVHEEGEVTFAEDGTPLRMAGTVQDVTDVALAERALAEKTILLNGLVQNSVAIIAIKDPDGRYVLVNPEFERALGVTKEEVLGKTAAQVFPDETAALWTQQDRQALEDQAVRIYENRVLLNDGSSHVYLAAKFPIRNADGRILGLATIATDMTERKQAEEALRRSEARLSAILENTPVQISERDMEGRYILVNSAWGAPHGLTIDDVRGRRLSDIFPAEVVEPFDDHVREVMETGRAVEREVTFPQPDGLRSYISIKFPIRDADGRMVSIGSVSADITERKRAEEALRRSEERFRDFAEGANDWVWEMDADLRYTYLSPSYEQYSGIPVAAVLGKTRQEVYAHAVLKFPPDELERWHELNRLLETRQTFRNFEHRWVKPDGEERFRLSTGKPVFDAQGRFQGYRGVGSDITGVKRRDAEIRAELERLVEARTAELRAAQEELVRKERLAALGQLTGTVSHELRNPLGALRASVATVRKLARDDQPLLQRTVEIIDRSITRCDNIIGDLLDYSRGETLEREATDLESWLGALLDEYAPPAGVAVERDIAPGVEAAFDRERLRRVVFNLLDNACQAMTEAPAGEDPPGGTLRVSTRRSRGRVEIEVADDGPGIAAEDLGRIFEPLFSTKSFGVGLGLPIVRRVMASHGGGVEVDSAPGRGTRFVLWLPADQELRRTGS